MAAQRFDSVPGYIASFPPATQAKLKQVRKAIRDAVPDAEESISYHMPTYKRGAWKLYFSGYRSHVSLHGAVEVARPRLSAALAKEMAQFEASGRGTLKLPLDRPIPGKLVAAIARAGVEASGEAAAPAGRKAKPRRPARA